LKEPSIEWRRRRNPLLNDVAKGTGEAFRLSGFPGLKLTIERRLYERMDFRMRAE